ncbi:hypothetical protein FAY30_24110 [Bacillus sp. S3]|uniref:hypothetical protein n=1 Tax=Bacillus sp. S3 TaxID=486398 RepID=UPI00118BF1C2|nr:hypothetical protein [Bacillus sp. S3]QCJ44719.1 hypothetical protein FAY30_24110 [Bacillus sp. S3]
MLAEDEAVFYTMDLYDQILFEGQSLAEWLYSGETMRDEKKAIQLKLRKMQEEEKEIQQQRIEKLQNSDYQEPVALLAFHPWTDPKINKHLLIHHPERCLDARRFYLELVEDTSVFLEECKNCFPQLYIHERVHQTIKRFKPFRDYRGEVILHLNVLNDHGRRLFLEFQHQSENVVLQHLGTIGNIHCSPQGDPDYEKKYLCFDFPSDSGGLIKIICAPHTKLFKKHSGERIYFHWGHAHVRGGEKILIGHIGEHL